MSLLLFSRTDLAVMFGVDVRTLVKYVKKYCPENVELTKKGKHLTDLDVYNIIKSLKPLLSDSEIKRLIDPKGHFYNV